MHMALPLVGIASAHCSSFHERSQQLSAFNEEVRFRRFSPTYLFSANFVSWVLIIRNFQHERLRSLEVALASA